MNEPAHVLYNLKMADSDEEHDRKKRDKFRRERSDYSSNERRRSDSDGRRVPSWREEYYEARRRSREEERERGRGYGSSPPRRDWSPPDSKRFRRGGGAWDDLSGPPPPMIGPYSMIEVRGPWMLPPPGDVPPRGAISPGSRSLPGDVMLGLSPAGGLGAGRRGLGLLSFKQFLAQQDDGIDDMEAVKLYHEYKADFKKKQIHQFFNDHKEEDWFLSRYYPKHVERIEEASKSHVLKRLEVFCCLREKARTTPVTQGETDNIVKLMNTAVILMEGGTETDLQTLEDEDEKEEGETDNKVNERESSSKGEKEEEEEETLKENGRKRGRDDDDDDDDDDDEELLPSESKKRGRGNSNDGESDKSSPKLEPETETGSVLAPPTSNEEPQPETGQSENQTESETHTNQSRSETPPEKKEPLKPRPLHLTKAVYIRHITPQVSMADLVEVCKNISGFLRVGLAEVQPDRGFERRGWVTFSHDTNIKTVSVKLGSQKVKNCMLTCQVNRDLSRRVKVTSTSVVWSRRAVESDVQLLAKLINHFDKKWHLWSYSVDNDEEREEGEGEMEEGLKEPQQPKENPVLIGVTECISVPPVSTDTPLPMEEGKEEGEEEEEEGEEGEKDGAEDKETGSERDGEGGDEEEGVIDDPGTEILKSHSPLIQTLDQLIWYLRLVHSFDYYNGAPFPDEDSMPNRCGIITARPDPPTAVTNEEVNSYIKSMEGKMEPVLKEKVWLSEEEMEKLGKRNQESEVEKFIEVNTQKLGENKYLCPLSGKKFRGPEFVRKHIMNKHKASLEEVKDETVFFNNYLKDPERPDSSLSSGGDEDKRGRGGGGGWSNSQNPVLLPGFHDMRRGRGGRGFRGGRDRRGGGRRPVRSYNDLDMPDDMY